MSLFIASLNSGSNGNCYYIGNENEAVLIDAGISCRETEKRMAKLGLEMNSVKAIFISHEHSDHIKGLAVLSRKHQIPVYITRKTFLFSGLQIEEPLLHTFEPDETILIGELAVQAFTKSHDASDPTSFVVVGNGITIGIFTDIGNVCDNLIHYFQHCHAAFLEANYDEEMLENGKYPYHLKKRIKGGKGHLSNRQALELFIRYKPSFMSHLLLAHLSADNNNPELVEEMFHVHADNTEIIVASRFCESAIYQVYGNDSVFPTVVVEQMHTAQLNLFE